MNGVKPTRLYPHKRNVESDNVKELDQLPGEARVFYAVDSGEETYMETLKRACAAPTELTLKIGAQVVTELPLGSRFVVALQVMLLKNSDVESGLCNGARGTVVGYQPERDVTLRLIHKDSVAPIILFANGVRRVILPGTSMFSTVTNNQHDQQKALRFNSKA